MPLIKLELVNLFGINEYRNTKDKKKKREKTAVAAALAAVLLALMLQMAAQSWWMCRAGAGAVLPALMGAAAPLIIFVLSLHNRSLFSPCGYELLCSLPVKKSQIALGRLGKLYVEYFLLGALVSLPYGAVYAWAEQPEGEFYGLWAAGLLLQPLLPVSLSQWINGGILTVSSPLVHGRGVELTLQILLSVGALLLPYALLGFPAIPREPAELVALLKNLGESLPSWMGARLTDRQAFFRFAVLSAGAWGMTLVGAGLHGELMKKIMVPHRKHGESRLGAPAASLVGALYRKERKLYFSSPVYGSNTIIGPILATVLSAALMFVNPESLRLPFDIVAALPFGWCMVSVLLCPAPVSLSMEGDRIWILKTLPVPVKAIVQAKVLWSLSLLIPAFLLSGMFLTLAGLGSLWFWVLVPGMLGFAPLFGMAVNLRFQNYSWERPEEVVKQSMSGFVGGIIPSALCLVCGAGCLLLPELRWLMPLLFLPADGLLYYHCCHGQKLR